MSEPFWDKRLRDRSFFAFFTATIIAVAMLLSPYLYVLLFAAVAAVVSWPLRCRIKQAVGGRRTIAAGLTLLVLFVVVVGPLVVLGFMFVNEAKGLIAQGNSFIESGGFDALGADLSQSTPPQVIMAREWAAQWVPEGWLPEEGSVAPMVVQWLRTESGDLLRQVGNGLPKVLESVFSLGLDTIIFVFALFTLYIDGPRVLKVLSRISPMDDSYEDQLFGVFRELANNMVIATLVTAAIQGLVAALGFHIAGLDRIVFLGIVAGVASFIPLIGTLMVWGPASLYVAVAIGPGWAVFLVLWNMLLTGSVDNIVKPLFLRGNTQIHPLLIFLAVFGGLAWFGVPGVLIGPLFVAFFLAAYTIYAREYLKVKVTPPAPSVLPGWLRKLLPFVGRAHNAVKRVRRPKSLRTTVTIDEPAPSDDPAPSPQAGAKEAGPVD